MGERHEQAFHQERRSGWQGSTQKMMSSIKKMQSETTTRHYFTPVRTAKLKNNKP